MSTVTSDQNVPGNGQPTVFRNDVYAPENPHLPAECIYLYFISEDDPHDVIRPFVVDPKRHIPPLQLPGKIAEIVTSIKDGVLKPNAPSMKDVPWRRKSYFVVVLDHPTIKLESENAVTFDMGGQGNHTFRDGRDIPALPKPHGHMSAFFCFNHMKKKAGDPWEPGDSEEFKVVVNHPHSIAQPSGTGAVIAKYRLMDHEDSGTNLGPPVPPPA